MTKKATKKAAREALLAKCDDGSCFGATMAEIIADLEAEGEDPVAIYEAAEAAEAGSWAIPGLVAS